MKFIRSVAFRIRLREGRLWRISRSMKIGKESADFGSGEAFEDHADWMMRASRMLDEDGVAERGVERSFAGWFGSADVGRTVQKAGDMLESLI
jgi:hypothetical protein